MDDLTELASLFAINRFIDRRINESSMGHTQKENSPYKFNTNSKGFHYPKSEFKEMSPRNKKMVKCIPITDYKSIKIGNSNSSNHSNNTSLREDIVKNISTLSINHLNFAFSSLSRNTSRKKLNFDSNNLSNENNCQVSNEDIKDNITILKPNDNLSEKTENEDLNSEENKIELPSINFSVLENIYSTIEEIYKLLMSSDTLTNAPLLKDKSYYLLSLFNSSEFYTEEFILSLLSNSKTISKLVKESIFYQMIYFSYLSIIPITELTSDELARLLYAVPHIKENFINLLYLIIRLINFPFVLDDSNTINYKNLNNLLDTYSIFLTKKISKSKKSLYIKSYHLNLLNVRKNLSFLLNSTKSKVSFPKGFISIMMNYLKKQSYKFESALSNVINKVSL